MKRRILNVFTGLSLALCVGIAFWGAWSRRGPKVEEPLISLWWGDAEPYSHWHCEVRADGGRLGISVRRVNGPSVPGPYLPSNGSRSSPALTAFDQRFGPSRAISAMGLGLRWGPTIGTDAHGQVWMLGTSLGIWLPNWFLVLLAGLLPGLRLFAALNRWRLNRARPERGLCLHCGYDLRAHKPGDRCPECGTVIPSGATPASAVDQRE